MIKIIILVLFFHNAFASEHNEFVEFFENIDSFNADFIQDIDNKKTSGVVSFMRPKNLKWHTTKPDEKTLMLTGGKITFYDEWLQTANIVNYVHNDLVEYLTTTPSKLKKIPQFVTSNNTINYYRIDSNLETLYFGFLEGILKEILVLDNNGKQTYIKLENLLQNINLKNIFEIDFKKGTDIMDESN